MSFIDTLLGSGASHDDVPNHAYMLPLAKRDYATALPLLKSATARDDARAMGILAALYALGRGVEKDPVEACAWFRQSAVRGDAQSQTALGLCLANGKGTAANPKEAAYWLWRAAQAGVMQAISLLGALADRHPSVVGEHFSEDELCAMLEFWHDRLKEANSGNRRAGQLH